MMRTFATTLLLLLINTVYAKKLIDVPLSLSAKDRKSGFQLSPKYTVTPSKGGTTIPVKIVNGENTATVTVGESYKVVAELEGYFTKEQTVEITQENVPEGKVIVMNLDPQPSAMLSFVVTDSETNDAIEATITLTGKSKSYKGKTLKENPTYKFVVTQPDSYQVEVNAAGYNPQKFQQNIEVGDPPRQITKPIALTKIGNGIKILILGEDTNKPIRGVKLTITNTTDKQVLIDNILPEAEAQIEVNSNKKYSANIEADGYVSRKMDINPNGNQTIKLQAITYFSISAYDNLLNKKIPAAIKVKLKGELVAELKAEANGEVRFNPKDKGKYEFEASMNGFRNGFYETDLNNMNSGKLPVRINLESAVDAFVIIVQDSESKQLVENSKVIFVGKDGVLVPSKYNQKTGEWKFELEKDKEYQLSITAPNYVSIDETFIRPPSKLISKSLKKMEQSIFYKAVDALTKRPITANYKVTKPDQSVITGTSDATKQFTVNMKPQLTYSIEIGAEGYKSITEKINFSIDLKPEKIIELSRDSYPLTLKVIDNETKKVISNSKITVINQTSNQPLISKNNANGVFTEDFIHSNIYQAEFESEGYIKANQKINVVDILNKSNGEVELILTKIPVEKYKIIAINENDSKKVTSADLRIFNNQNQPVPVSLNPSEMEWLVELKKEDSYSVEVKAQGFLAYKSNLEIVKGTITIKLKPIPSQEVIINVFDALTKKPITANYKLNSGNESIPGSVSNGSSKFNMNLLQDKNYDLEVNSNGYKSYKEAVKVNKEGKNEFNIDLKKEFYTFNFKAIDSKTNKSIGKVSLKIINDKDKQSLTPKFEQSSNEFVSNLASDNTYSAEFEANGYNKNSLKIDVNALARNSEFNKELLLEPVIIEPKVEPKKEEPKKELEPKNVEVKITTPKEEPKKEEPKKEEPKKEEPKKETPKPNPPVKKEEKRVVDDAIVIEETELSVKVEVYENLVVGKRYRLGSVLFEQGTPTLKPKSNLQLEKLVRTLKLNPKLKIEVTGHTDNVGDARLNQILSEQRATKIGNYLFNGGIAENRIISIGKGQEEPIAPNDNELNKAKNRRVEFVLKDK